jgi:hypothetical protein
MRTDSGNDQDDWRNGETRSSLAEQTRHGGTMKSDNDTKPPRTSMRLTPSLSGSLSIGNFPFASPRAHFLRRPTAAAAIVAVLLAVEPWPALSQVVELIVVDVTTVATGYRASKLIGRAVVNDQNERIGAIDDIVIGRDHVLFAILQIGGFLGVGGQLVAVPYQSLVLDESGEKISLPGATREQLKKLPEFMHRS